MFIGSPITIEVEAHNKYYAEVVLRQLLSEYVNDLVDRGVDIVEV